MFEVLIASSIMAVAVAAISQAVSTGQVQTHVALHEMRANQLAEALMEEIIALPYNDPDGGGAIGPESGEVQPSQFDNVDDFHGFSETIGQVKDLAGNSYPSSFSRFGRSVSVQTSSVTAAQLGGTFDGLNVVVTITDNNGQTWTLSRFIPQSTP